MFNKRLHFLVEKNLDVIKMHGTTIKKFSTHNLPPIFWTLSRNSEKRLLTSSCLFVRLFFCFSVCLSVSPHEQLGSHMTDFHEIWYLSIFQKIYKEKLKFRRNMTRIVGTLHEDLRTFMISCWSLLRKKNYSGWTL